MAIIKCLILSLFGLAYFGYADNNVLSPQTVALTHKAYESRLATLKAALVRRKRQCCSQCLTNNGCGCGGCPQIIQPMQATCTPICQPMCTSACVQQYACVDACMPSCLPSCVQAFQVAIPPPQPTCVQQCQPQCDMRCLQAVQVQVQQQCDMRCMPACQPTCLNAIQIQTNQVQCVQPCMPNCDVQCIKAIVPNCPQQCFPTCSPQCIQANLVTVRPTCVQACQPDCSVQCIKAYEIRNQPTCVEVCRPACQRDCVCNNCGNNCPQMCNNNNNGMTVSQVQTFSLPVKQCDAACMPTCSPVCVSKINLCPQQCRPMCTNSCVNQYTVVPVQVQTNQVQCVQPCMPLCNSNCLKSFVPNCPQQCYPSCSPQCIQAFEVQIQVQQQCPMVCRPACQRDCVCSNCGMNCPAMCGNGGATLALQMPAIKTCVPACMPQCDSACVSSATTAQLTMPCVGNPCQCNPGYVECGPNTCCLRYKNMAKRFSKSLTQKLYYSPKGYTDMANAALNQHSQSTLQFSQGDENQEKNDDLSADKDEPNDTEDDIVHNDDPIDYKAIKQRAETIPKTSKTSKKKTGFSFDDIENRIL